MRFCVYLLTLLMTTAYASDAQLARDANQVKQSVLELNQELYQLEQDLLSPATTQISFFFSLRGGEYFTPLAIEINAAGVTPIHYLYTERQVQALRMGAVQPVAVNNIGPGVHRVEVLVRGIDKSGQEQTLTLQEQVEKTSAPLLLEIIVSDVANERRAIAQLKNW